MSDTGSSGATARTQSDDRTLAYIVYGMHFVSPFVFGLTALIGVVMAYVRKPEADTTLASHYRFQIRTFWIGFGLAMITAFGIMSGVTMMFWELGGALLSDMPSDAAEAVTRDLNVQFPIAAFISLVVAGCAWIATALWMILAAAFGSLRLSGGHGIGRGGATA